MTVLAVDIGGTKTLLTLVEGEIVEDRIELATERTATPEARVQQIGELADKWFGHFDRAGVTVTGLVKDDCWRALNAETLAIPGQFALREAAECALSVPVTLCNDAQAAAWGEYAHGAGKGKDIVFVTISTGVGGGIVANGQLLSGRGGLAGHFGQTLPMPDGEDVLFEDGASGRWIASQSKKLGYAEDARSVFAAASDGDKSAENILQASANRVGRLCHNLQLMFDPQITIVGGGVGLAPGYIERMNQCIEHYQPLVRPSLVTAALGKDAGVIGVADLTKRNQTKGVKKQ